MLLKIKKVLGFIEANLEAKITVDELAEFARVSRSHLYYLFKVETGVAPIQYIKRVRIEKARDLLEQTNLSIKQIRSRVGLADRSHFTRGFKEAFGVTPSEYRNRLYESRGSEYNK
jgi:two-component system, response regulator YesN